MKLKTGYSDYPDDALYHLGETASDNITAQPIWATLKPTAADIKAATDNLAAARAMVGRGRKQAITAARALLAARLADVAMNAPQIPGATETDLAEIGLPEVKTPTRTTTLPGECMNVRFFHGELPGEVVGRCNPLGRTVRVYEAQWTLDPSGTDWSEPVTFPNSRAFKFSGLPRGKDVWIRVRGRNVLGAGAWSDPATIMVI